jgi:hypothetical protein
VLAFLSQFALVVCLALLLEGLLLHLRNNSIQNASCLSGEATTFPSCSNRSVSNSPSNMHLPRTRILISNIHHPCSIDGSRGRQLPRSLQTAPSTWKSSRNKLRPVSFHRIRSRIQLVLPGVKALQAQRGCYPRVHYHTLPPILETRRHFHQRYVSFTTKTGGERNLLILAMFPNSVGMVPCISLPSRPSVSSIFRYSSTIRARNILVRRHV